MPALDGFSNPSLRYVSSHRRATGAKPKARLPSTGAYTELLTVLFRSIRPYEYMCVR